MLMVVDDVVVVDPGNEMLHIIFTFQMSRLINFIKKYKYFF